MRLLIVELKLFLVSCSCKIVASYGTTQIQHCTCMQEQLCLRLKLLIRVCVSSVSFVRHSSNTTLQVIQLLHPLINKFKAKLFVHVSKALCLSSTASVAAL